MVGQFSDAIKVSEMAPDMNEEHLTTCYHLPLIIFSGAFEHTPDVLDGISWKIVGYSVEGKKS